MKKIMCKKLKKEGEALSYLPYPGDLGKRIQESISEEAWEQWVSHQTMLINEMKLTPVEPKARKFLEEEMEKFFFGDGSQAPQGFVPEK
ncbi:oxidative damage protection protein [Gammaproteobacteria bacterium]|jgi:Fe-S cluster biosynthesis and repair protein YggX|nr:oxidative damage protection protein [Gammaproteobacteria bacterium]MDC0985201.1 oxidative damage protection protein [Gammaproteobacteria bacterium]|tara:strand:- start:325 stop:591 length:267 start_codon:yes stop_codon:yes gene_type:complete